MKTAVIGDLHGNAKALDKLWEKIGFAHQPKERRKLGQQVIQLGDLVDNGKRTDRDAEFYEDTKELIDVQLFGNHCYYLVAPYSPVVVHSGSYRSEKACTDAIKADFAAGERWTAAVAVGDWLVTHAGVHPFWLAKYWKEEELPAKYLADAINWRFARYIKTEYGPFHFNGGQPDVTGYMKQAPEDRDLFDAIPINRGGWDQFGGIFWGDWDALKESYDVAEELPQIVGHTPRGDHKPECHKGLLWNIDVEAKCSPHACALITEDEGITWEPIVV